MKKISTRSGASNKKKNTPKQVARRAKAKSVIQEYNNDLGQYLSEARKANELTMANVADVIGLKSGQSIWDWENGKGSGIPADTLLRLVKLYGLSADEAYDKLIAFHQSRVLHKVQTKFEKARQKVFGRRAS